MPEGQDGLFSIELSASVIGSWFLNGTELQEDERYSMRRSRTHQSLRIQGVRDTDNGAEITFIAYGIRDSAALYIQGMRGSLTSFVSVCVTIYQLLVCFTTVSLSSSNSKLLLSSFRRCQKWTGTNLWKLGTQLCSTVSCQTRQLLCTGTRMG